MRPLAILLAACGCEPRPGDDTGEPPPPATTPVTDYEVIASWTPDDCPAPGETIEFYEQVVDQLGRPIPDLQQSHERMIHTLFVSEDLESFQHVHHEDFYDITADDLRNSTFHFPISFPFGGGYRIVYDFAHMNVFQARQGWIDVCGDPPMLPAPNPDFTTEVDAGDVHVSLVWAVEPRVGDLAQWSIFVTHAADGTDVTDLAQWLGADGHAALISADLVSTGHTHAWTPGVDNMSPNMQMPHFYTGPEVAFQYTFPQAGLYRMWIQFARETDPETPYTAPFWFEVAP
jgi:hypothetical protein